MPRTGGERRRNEIVSCAGELFRAKGYNQVGLSEILKAAGVSRGSFYFHFKSKKELCKAVIQQRHERMRGIFQEAFAEGEWSLCARRLVDLLVGQPRTAAQHRAPFACLALEFAGEDPQIVDAVGAVFRQMETGFARALEERGLPAGQSRRRAATLLACFEGHVLRAGILRMTCCMDELADNLAYLRPAGPWQQGNPALSMSELQRMAPLPVLERVRRFVEMRLDLIDNRSIISHQGEGAEGYAQKRRDVLRQSAVLFWRRGFHAVALVDILAACDVPKGSFYYYFASKSALAAEVLENYKTLFCAALDAVFKADTWPQAVSAFYRLLEDLAVPAGSAGVSMAQMGHGFVTAGEELAVRVVEILRAAERSFEKALIRFFPGCANPAERAIFAVALCIGHIARMLIYRDASASVQLSEDLLALAP